jgi:2-polyprenyl-6-methoxyphenol hydroxylase-like FAD-dependent oxidoreductase
MTRSVDALVIGAGPAGSATALLLAAAGWRVALVEQHAYPRQKVCGECLTPGGLALLDALGVGGPVLERAGPAITRVGWMGDAPAVMADLPSGSGPHRHGRALGRDLLDAILVSRAHARGVQVLQPARVRSVRGSLGNFTGEIEWHRDRRGAGPIRASSEIRCSIVVDAHGSWEPGPRGTCHTARAMPRGSDLFGFKSSFHDTKLPPGLLPVLAFEGGYGGLVVAERGRLTLAGCIRRDTLQAWRAQRRGESAGTAMEEYLRRSCRGVRDALDGAHRAAPWLSVGPLRPGIRASSHEGVFLVGNAAGEMHPLIGEGMAMALQSAFLLADQLTRSGARASAGAGDPGWARRTARSYETAWRAAFMPKWRLAAAYAHLAMRAPLARPAAALLERFPRILTAAARWAGKSRVPTIPSRLASPSGTL